MVSLFYFSTSQQTKRSEDAYLRSLLKKWCCLKTTIMTSNWSEVIYQQIVMLSPAYIPLFFVFIFLFLPLAGTFIISLSMSLSLPSFSYFLRFIVTFPANPFCKVIPSARCSFLGPYHLCFNPIFTIFLFASLLSSSSLPSLISSVALLRPLLIIFVFLPSLRPT